MIQFVQLEYFCLVPVLIRGKPTGIFKELNKTSQLAVAVMWVVNKESSGKVCKEL